MAPRTRLVSWPLLWSAAVLAGGIPFLSALADIVSPGDSGPVAHRAAAHAAHAAPDTRVRLVPLRAADTLATSTAVPTPTDLATIAPTPDGTSIPVGRPLPTPAAGPGAITANDAYALRELVRLGPHPSCEDCTERFAAFAPDGRTLYTTLADVAVVARAVADGSSTWEIPQLTGTFDPTVAVSPDGQTLAVGGDRSIEFRAADHGALARTVLGRGGGAMTFTADGRQLVVLYPGAWATVFDVARGIVLADRRVVPFADVTPRVRPGHAQVSAVPFPSKILVGVDIVSGREAWRLDPVTGPDSAIGNLTAWSADGREISWTEAPVSSSVAQVCRSDLGAPAACAPLDVNGGWMTGRQLSVARSGRVVAAGERHSHPGVCSRLGVDVWDGEPQMRTVFEAPDRQLDAFDLSPDGTLLAIGHAACRVGDARETTIVAVATGQVLARLPGVTSPLFSPDGSRLVVTGSVAVAGGTRTDLRIYGVDRAGAAGRRVWLPVASRGE